MQHISGTCVNSPVSGLNTYRYLSRMIFECSLLRGLRRFASSHALNHHVYSKSTNSNIVNFHEEEARVSMDLLLAKGRKFQRNEKSGRCILSVFIGRAYRVAAHG